MSASNNKVKVYLRLKPIRSGGKKSYEIVDDKRIHVHRCGNDLQKSYVNNQIRDWEFTLNGIKENVSQTEIYDDVARPVVLQAMKGYNATILAYGQTGAGKTYTMTGATESYRQRGLIPRSLSEIFKAIDQSIDQNTTIRISYVEIYNESFFDLLSTVSDVSEYERQNLHVTEEVDGSCYIKGLSDHIVNNEEEALNLLFEGETNRAISSHVLNKNSSRSHCIFTIYLQTHSRTQSDPKYTVSKINFVDLAGSERLRKTKSEGRTQTEAVYINKSLTFLEQTVLSLADKKTHIPYRQSKLTHCLKDSLGGNSNTVMIGNVWSEEEHIEETISTIRFATRMMKVHTVPVRREHEDPTKLVKQMKTEIEHLKRELAMHDTLVNRSHVTYENLSEQQRGEIREQVKNFLSDPQCEIDIVNIRQIKGVFETFRDIYGIMSSEIEKNVEDKFRSRYTLLDKQDAAAIAQAQQAGVPIDDNGDYLVGETDGSGYGIPGASGKPVPSSAVNAKKKESKKKEKRSSPTTKGQQSPETKGRTTEQTPSPDKQPKTSSIAPPPEQEKKEQEPSQNTPVEKPSTPPPRSEAFEEFKKGLGSEINRILSENKDILGAKKRAYTTLARQINLTKSEIDSTKCKLNDMRDERESLGNQVDQNGAPIISEEEYNELNRLKGLKNSYKTDFEELKNLKTEVAYCQKQVDLCRQKLIQGQ
ncbi:DgyrCDS4768 [Dimorphilus gyrociliatus]|uniref:Kinesin-like protein n=1 Tax=Dimorphilus gyrociliatus TaxID=2664684 RepID=A0A7I8VHK4_9ANNE|nr:DgyrCDS4768 [Dimorphilus gyrociliatus]